MLRHYMISMQTKRVIWIEKEIAERLDQIGEEMGLSPNRNRYADVARMILNKRISEAQ